MPDDDPLTRAEIAFRELVADRRAFARWSAQVLAEWTARKAAERAEAEKKASKPPGRLPSK